MNDYKNAYKVWNRFDKKIRENNFPSKIKTILINTNFKKNLLKDNLYLKKKVKLLKN